MSSVNAASKCENMMLGMLHVWQAVLSKGVFNISAATHAEINFARACQTSQNICRLAYGNVLGRGARRMHLIVAVHYYATSQYC